MWKGWAARRRAVALGIFGLITSELLPVGLLTPVGSDLGVSDGSGGPMLTVPGLVAGFRAPLVAVGSGRLDRRFVLCVLIALMAVANLAAALAPGFTVVLAARLLVGVSVGGLWAVASAKSAAGGPPSARSASSASSHWPPRSCCCPRCRRPATSPSPSSSAAPRELRGPRQCDRHLPSGSGQLAANTFVRPVLQDVSGVAAHHVCRLLLGYGVAAVAGNFPARPRDARRTLLVVSASLAVILARGRPPGAVAGTVLLLARGLAHGGVSVSL